MGEEASENYARYCYLLALVTLSVKYFGLSVETLESSAIRFEARGHGGELAGVLAAASAVMSLYYLLRVCAHRLAEDAEAQIKLSFWRDGGDRRDVRGRQSMLSNVDIQGVVGGALWVFEVGVPVALGPAIAFLMRNEIWAAMTALSSGGA